ncbi:MAG: carboxylate--amine ligase [Gemmatimonadetes bacterium]|nr:MAG: carboxylate--amine ligase [Gemmatimonadota bacterium]
MAEIYVGISGINAVDNPGPGVGVARSLHEDPDLKVHVVGLAYDTQEPGIYMDWVINKAFIMPYPSADAEAYLQRLHYIKHSYGLDVVLPCLDAELPFFTKYQHEIAALGIRTFLPTLDQFNLRGKDRLADIAEAIQVSIPPTKVVTSLAELHRAVERIGLPVMVKGAFYKAYKAYTYQEAVAHYHKLVAEWGYPVIVQGMVFGEEMNVVAVGDGQGELLGQVGIKKMWITSLGKIWTGVTIKNERMRDVTANFIRRYRWKGPLEMECMVDGDTVYLIEINPRFPAWSYFATGVGVNLPANIIRKIYQLPLPATFDYDPGKLYIRYTDELVTDMQMFQKITTQGEN